MAEAGLFEIMYSTRSMRKLKTDPIPDEVLYKILEAGIQAPSGTNTQHWRFLVVKDPEVKKKADAEIDGQKHQPGPMRYGNQERPQNKL